MDLKAYLKMAVPGDPGKSRASPEQDRAIASLPKNLSMYSLSYSSIISTGYGTGDLKNIREESQAYNSENDITGCLFFRNDEFVEVIEGKKRAVLRLFARIRTDLRHHDLSILWGETHERRYFDGWGLGFHEPSDNPENMSRERRFVHDMLWLHDLSDSSTATVRAFWAVVRGLLTDRSPNGDTEP